MEVNFKHDYKDCFGNKILEENSKESIPKAIWRHLAFSLFNLSSVVRKPLTGRTNIWLTLLVTVLRRIRNRSK